MSSAHPSGNVDQWDQTGAVVTSQLQQPSCEPGSSIDNGISAIGINSTSAPSQPSQALSFDFSVPSQQPGPSQPQPTIAHHSKTRPKEKKGSRDIPKRTPKWVNNIALGGEKTDPAEEQAFEELMDKMLSSEEDNTPLKASLNDWMDDEDEPQDRSTKTLSRKMKALPRRAIGMSMPQAPTPKSVVPIWTADEPCAAFLEFQEIVSPSTQPAPIGSSTTEMQPQVAYTFNVVTPETYSSDVNFCHVPSSEAPIQNPSHFPFNEPPQTPSNHSPFDAPAQTPSSNPADNLSTFAVPQISLTPSSPTQTEAEIAQPSWLDPSLWGENTSSLAPVSLQRPTSSARDDPQPAISSDSENTTNTNWSESSSMALNPLLPYHNNVSPLIYNPFPRSERAEPTPTYSNTTRSDPAVIRRGPTSPYQNTPRILGPTPMTPTRPVTGIRGSTSPSFYFNPPARVTGEPTYGLSKAKQDERKEWVKDKGDLPLDMREEEADWDDSDADTVVDSE